MKNFIGKKGISGSCVLGITVLTLIFPLSNFPQDKNQTIHTQIINKNKQQARPDSSQLKIAPHDISKQDSTRQIMFPARQDTTIDFLPKIKPDYSNLTLKIEINDGLQYTKSKEVVLNLIAPQATEMVLGNKEDLSDGQWESFQPDKKWVLTDKDENKAVYFRVRYPDSTLSRIIFDEIILNSSPPVIKFQVIPDSGIAGETLFSFDATECSHSFDILLRWDWDDDGHFDTDWSHAKEEGYRYRLGGGRKRVRLEIKDNRGWIVSTTKEIIVYSRPHPDFSYTQDFTEPLKITSDASGSGDYEDGNNLQYRWDLNADSLWDSEWSMDKTITHVFEPFDEILVSVEARDSQGLTNIFTSKIVNSFNDMVYIPAGEFTMGNDEYELDERPAHVVFVDDFWIDKYLVTNKEYADFLNEFINKYPEREPDIPRFIDLSDEDSRIRYEVGEYLSNHIYRNHPVVNVTWYGAEAYCQFYGKRLPSEAEWEKAARGTDERIYAWGSTVDSSRANYWNSGDPFDDNTTPVGFYNGQYYEGFQTNDSPSFFGVYDMGGNVKEWGLDWYLRNYYSQSPKFNPPGPSEGMKKVVRGGGYLFHPDQLRVTFRYAVPPEKSTNFIGFRCVKSFAK